MNLPLV